MVNRYSWHKLGTKGECGLAECLNAYFWMKLVAQRGTITQTPLCAKFVPRISVDHWVRGVWAYYYLGFRPRRPLALHRLGLYLSPNVFSALFNLCIVRLCIFGSKGIITLDPPLWSKFVPEWIGLLMYGLADYFWIVRLHNVGSKGIITLDPPIWSKFVPRSANICWQLSLHFHQL